MTDENKKYSKFNPVYQYKTENKENKEDKLSLKSLYKILEITNEYKANVILPFSDFLKLRKELESTFRCMNNKNKDKKAYDIISCLLEELKISYANKEEIFWDKLYEFEFVLFISFKEKLVIYDERSEEFDKILKVLKDCIIVKRAAMENLNKTLMAFGLDLTLEDKINYNKLELLEGLMKNNIDLEKYLDFWRNNSISNEEDYFMYAGRIINDLDYYYVLESCMNHFRLFEIMPFEVYVKLKSFIIDVFSTITDDDIFSISSSMILGENNDNSNSKEIISLLKSNRIGTDMDINMLLYLSERVM